LKVQNYVLTECDNQGDSSVREELSKAEEYFVR